MNPLASTKSAGRLLVALAATSSILFAVGCGSSSSTPPNQEGFGPSNLNGTYVFTSEGVDAGGYLLAVAGAFVANGDKGITGGTMDVVDANPNSPVLSLGQAITSGSYAVGTDGRGQVSLTSSVGTIVLDFVLTTSTSLNGVSSHGLVTEFDSNGSGSGTLDLQTAITSLAGSYAFSLAGSDSDFNPFATTGAFTLGSDGTINPGVEDFNDNGNPAANETLTGSATLGSGTAPGPITLSTNSFGLTFDFYPIDSTHWKLIETDGIEFLAGDVFSQPSTSIPTTPMAFTMSGGTNTSGPIANAGFLTYTASNSTFAGAEDYNNNGTVLTNVQFSGIASSAGPVGGRVTVSLTGFTPDPTDGEWVVYPSSGGLLMLEIDSANITVGAAYAQTLSTFGTSQGYGFNLSAFNISGGYVENDIAQFTTTSSGFTGAVDINDDGGSGTVLSFDQALATTAFTAPNSNGEGSATTTAAGNQFVGFNFYMLDSSTFLVLETDSIQIGAGMFELQSSGCVVCGAAHRATSMVRPLVHPHAAMRHK